MKRTQTDQTNLNRIAGLTKTALAQRLPGLDSLTKARNKLSELVVAAKTIEMRGVGDRVPDEFVAGLDQVISASMAFRSGYASNDASQVIDPNSVPGFAPTNTIKSAKDAIGLSTDGTPVAKEGFKRVPISPDFVTYAASIFKGLAKKSLSDQLASLRALEHTVAKANEEDFSDVMIPTDNDPMKQQADREDGSVVAGATGAAAPQDASTNFSVNSGAVTAPPPSKDPNPATGTVQQGMTGTGAPQDASSNFADGLVPSAANIGPATSGATVATAARGAGETGAAPVNFASTDVGATGTQQPTVNKSAAVVDPLAEIENPAPVTEAVSWPRDLNSREFMAPETADVSKSFGDGNDWDFFGPYRGPSRRTQK